MVPHVLTTWQWACRDIFGVEVTTECGQTQRPVQNRTIVYLPQPRLVCFEHSRCCYSYHLPPEHLAPGIFCHKTVFATQNKATYVKCLHSASCDCISILAGLVDLTGRRANLQGRPKAPPATQNASQKSSGGYK